MVKTSLNAGIVICASALFALSLCGLLISTAVASDLVWEGDVYSSGVEVSSPLLSYSVRYRVVAQEIWWYNNPAGLAADAMYYTTDPSDHITWGNYFPAPGGGSFLQIDGQNVSWGPFANGVFSSGGHTYTIYVTGTGNALTFRIRDWVDGSTDNNFCHLHLWIYREVTVGGHIADPSSSMITGFAIGAVVFAAVVTVPLVRRRRQD